jgi:hypothetical protein
VIALPQRLPYVVWRPDRMLPICEGWLAESLRAAADRAGFKNWELASHIARAILLYLEEEFAPNTISIGQLEEMMATTLTKVGFAEIAQHSALASPRLALSLAEIADQAPYELLFYPTLRERLDEIMSLDAAGVLIADLRLCVKILDHAGRWRQTCEALRDQIIHYIRGYIEACRGERLDLVIV